MISEHCSGLTTFPLRLIVSIIIVKYLESFKVKLDLDFDSFPKVWLGSLLSGNA